jgi:hypothetical protein
VYDGRKCGLTTQRTHDGGNKEWLRGKATKETRQNGKRLRRSPGSPRDVKRHRTKYGDTTNEGKESEYITRGGEQLYKGGVVVVMVM